MWDKERKERKTAAPEIPCATLADLHVEGGRRGPFSSRPRPSRRRLLLSPQHSKDPNPPLSSGRRGHGTTSRSPVGTLRHTGRTDRSRQPQPTPPPATSLAWPHRHGFPSLCARLANHQAASVGTGIIDRRRQPIRTRHRAVPGTRALLKRATVRHKNIDGGA